MGADHHRRAGLPSMPLPGRRRHFSGFLRCTLEVAALAAPSCRSARPEPPEHAEHAAEPLHRRKIDLLLRRFGGATSRSSAALSFVAMSFSAQSISAPCALDLLRLARLVQKR
jgi:hypothetical protein